MGAYDCIKTSVWGFMPFLFQDILSNKKELKACVEAIEKGI